MLHSSRFIMIIPIVAPMFFAFVVSLVVKGDPTKDFLLSTVSAYQAADPSVLSGLTQALSAISSIAVILGVAFVIIQLRQNNKLIELNAKQTQATFQEEKSNLSFELLEKLTDESFARRRSFMHQTVKKYQAANWEGFDDSADDFEIRNFAYMYDLFGQMAKDGLIDADTLANTFKLLVALDWQAFKPASDHIVERYGLKQNEMFSNFEWLAEETEKTLRQKGSDFAKIIHEMHTGQRHLSEP